MDVVERMRSQLADASMDADSHQTTTTTTDNTVALNQLKELDETMKILANGAATLNEDAQQLNKELPENERTLHELRENTSQVRFSVEEERAPLDRVIRNLEILRQDVILLEEIVRENRRASYDGTLTWKIKNFGHNLGE